MVRFTQLRSVDMNALIPPSRLCAEKPHRWTAADRFAKCGAVVTELYSRHLDEGEPVPAQTSWVRLVPDERVAQAGFGDTAMSDGLGEVHEVPFDPTVLELPDQKRRLAILEFVHENLLALASRRAWPTAPFEEAYRACLADGLRLELVGATKSSPDRRRRARARYTLDGNGDGWTVVEILDRTGDVVGRSEPFDSPWVSRGFGRIKKTLRWQDGTSVSLVPWWEVGAWEGQRRTVQSPAA